mmetsp:Transcript_96506/g.311198  ORF Transcript_96506/g.311198 Transcript_96506/m.311198 type:complete len:585 (+) Transcript_96506:67-1821(+)
MAGPPDHPAIRGYAKVQHAFAGDVQASQSHVAHPWTADAAALHGYAPSSSSDALPARWPTHASQQTHIVGASGVAWGAPADLASAFSQDYYASAAQEMTWGTPADPASAHAPGSATQGYYSSFGREMTWGTPADPTSPLGYHPSAAQERARRAPLDHSAMLQEAHMLQGGHHACAGAPQGCHGSSSLTYTPMQRAIVPHAESHDSATSVRHASGEEGSGQQRGMQGRPSGSSSTYRGTPARQPGGAAGAATHDVVVVPIFPTAAPARSSERSAPELEAPRPCGSGGDAHGDADACRWPVRESCTPVSSSLATSDPGMASGSIDELAFIVPQSAPSYEGRSLSQSTHWDQGGRKSSTSPPFPVAAEGTSREEPGSAVPGLLQAARRVAMPPFPVARAAGSESRTLPNVPGPTFGALAGLQAVEGRPRRPPFPVAAPTSPAQRATSSSVQPAEGRSLSRGCQGEQDRTQMAAIPELPEGVAGPVLVTPRSIPDEALDLDVAVGVSAADLSKSPSGRTATAASSSDLDADLANLPLYIAPGVAAALAQRLGDVLERLEVDGNPREASDIMRSLKEFEASYYEALFVG